MAIRWIYQSRLAKTLRVEAIVLFPFIFTSRAERDVTPRLIAHEMKHVEQITKLGIPRFYASYLKFYFSGLIKHRSHYKAYLAIPFEVEARDAEHAR